MIFSGGHKARPYTGSTVAEALPFRTGTS